MLQTDAMLDARDQAVAQLWDGQLTFRQVARAIGGMTAYEVRGIVDRLGLEAPKPTQAPVALPVLAAKPTVRFTSGGTIAWDDDLVAWLKQAWTSGRSAEAIAAELGGTTRNAIIGKVHRLGLSSRGNTNVVAAIVKSTVPKSPRVSKQSTALARLGMGPLQLGPQALPAAIAADRKQAEARAALVAPDVETGQRCTLMQLADGKCRWPVGDPQAPDFFFCGGRTSHGLPYCRYHARIAYQPRETRAARRRS